MPSAQIFEALSQQYYFHLQSNKLILNENEKLKEKIKNANKN